MALHIYTAAVNSPKFIELQAHAFRYYISGHYDFTVFNDAKDFPDYTNGGVPGGRADIRRTCERLNIPCIDISNGHHQQERYGNASDRCADSVNVMFDVQRGTRDRYLTVDSDLFPIHPMSSALYAEYDCAYVEHHRTLCGHRVNYMWPGLCYVDMATVEPKGLLQWDCMPALDCGGATTRFLAATRNRLYRIPYMGSQQWTADQYPASMDTRWRDYAVGDVRSSDGKMWPDIFDNQFMHFRAGSNWDGRPADELASRLAKLEHVVMTTCRD